MKDLVLGQEVQIISGAAGYHAKVAKTEPPCVYVDTPNGRFRFNTEGKECGPDGKAYSYDFNPVFGPGPWELEVL